MERLLLKSIKEFVDKDIAVNIFVEDGIGGFINEIDLETNTIFTEDCEIKVDDYFLDESNFVIYPLISSDIEDLNNDERHLTQYKLIIL